MSGSGTVLMFPDLKSIRSVLFGEQDVSAPAPGAEVLALGRLVIDRDRQQVRWAGTTLPLTRTERAVLAVLAAPPLRVWTYQQLYESAWGADYLDDVSAVRSAVKRLRAKLRKAGATVALKSTRGVGFSLADTGPER
ncbi:winged helix-turn-helix domain-containing protein [Nonomuraea sp. B12E4]|uniref:winged helix-turn-helix domain-containing protein n=1 Tax=Nonomuraea sp. B12E4 TaxID=3153564 RepID=UPI00325E62DF